MEYVYKLISWMFGGIVVDHIIWPPLWLLAIAIVLAVSLKLITYKIDKWVEATFGDYYTLYRWLKRDLKHNDANRKQE